MMVWIWLGVIVVALVVEFMTVSMSSLWFALGGIVSLILAAFGVGLVWQIVAFSIISFVCLLSLRKVTLKFLYRNKELKTNTNAMIGKQYFLIDEINEHQSGTIKVDGVVWSCKAVDNSDIKAGSKVEIKQVLGNKLLVEEVKTVVIKPEDIEVK